MGHWNIDVEYDPAVLSLDTCTAAPEGLCNVQFGPGTVRFVGATGDPDGLTGHVVLGTINFIAVGQEDDQTTLHPTVNELGNAAADPIDSTTVDGLVTIHAPTPSPTASPAPGDGRASSFSGLACLDLDCSGAASNVAALINGVQCAEVTIPIVVDGPVNETFYFINVPAASQTIACGTEGAIVSFTVNGRPAKQTGVWHSGAVQHLDIWAGEDFAAFSGALLSNGQPVSLAKGLPVLKAYIGAVECGERTISPGFAPGATSVSSYVLLIVLSDASRAGCGTPGAEVSLWLNGERNVKTATWTPGFHTHNLDFPRQSMSGFGGHVCLDSDCRDAAFGKRIAASVNGVECGEGYIYKSPLEGTFFGIDVPAATSLAGCGTEGGTVQFSIDGRPAKQTGSWHAGQSKTIDIWAGHEFAGFSGALLINGEPFRLTGASLPELKAYVGSLECGRIILGVPPVPTPFLPVPNYDLLVVLSDSSRPDCGREGSLITFTVNGHLADQTATWSPGFHTLALSAVQPTVLPRSGGPPTAANIPWALVSGGLVALIIGIASVGFAALQGGKRSGS